MKSAESIHSASVQERDAADLARVAQGDRAAFESLYDRFAARVYGLLIRMLRNTREAEDAMQETFWQIWDHANRYDSSRADPEAWIIMLARSRGIDQLRKRNQKVVSAGQEKLAAAAAPAEQTVELERSEAIAQTVFALSRLPAEQRGPIELSFYNGLSHQEISEQLSIPLGTVKTRIRTGMQRLREHLETREVIPS